MGSLFLHGVLADHIQFVRHLIAVIALEIVVEGFAIAGDRSTDTGGVGGEECCYLRAVVLEIEDRERRLPLVGVHADLPFGQAFIQTLHDHTGGIAEETGLVVVTVSGVALHLELVPRPRINLVFLSP